MEWTNKAVCIDWDVNLFFSDSKSDQLFAQSICQSCPVRQDCQDSGDAEDFKWSVRAGHLPGTFKGAPKRAPFFKIQPNPKIVEIKSSEHRKKDDWSYKYGKSCPQGHVFSAVNTDGYGMCKDCRKNRKRKSRGKIGR